MKHEQAIYTFIILMFVIYIIDYLINKRKLRLIKENKKKKTIGEIDYLANKFQLDKKKLNENQVIVWISLINSFIISLVSSIIFLLPFKMFINMFIAFILLLGLIYSLYEIYGRYLQKKEIKNNN